MTNKYKISLLICFAISAITVVAQPPSRRGKQQQDSITRQTTIQKKYPHSTDLPNDVIWTRGIYRELNLEKSPNGALNYPVESTDNKQNLITIIIKLLTENRITAYEYLLDGTERLTSQYQIPLRDILNRFHIPYQQQIVGRDSLLLVNNDDIPSAEILSYFVKEMWYFDQHTSTFNSRISAICPVLYRSDDTGLTELKMPMFWINYAELSPYLIHTLVPTSDFNNAATTSLDDFFTSRLYQGDIYKTANMLNKSLAQYYHSDSTLMEAQEHIEEQLLLFEQNLYGTDIQKDTIK